MRAGIAILSVLAAAMATAIPTTAEADTAVPVMETDRQTVVSILEPEPELEPEEQEEPENERIEEALLQQAHRLEDVTVTHYCTCARCCGKSDGITASGLMATPYVSVAVDPAVIPLGSDVLIDFGDGELVYCRADDTGGAIKGNHIDLCVGSHKEALELGVRTATVHWIEQK